MKRYPVKSRSLPVAVATAPEPITPAMGALGLVGTLVLGLFYWAVLAGALER